MQRRVGPWLFPACVGLAAAILGLGPVAGRLAAEPAVAEPEQAAGKPEKRKSTATVAHIRLAGSLPDGVGQGGLLADVSPHLHRLVERIDKAAKDAKVKALVLQIDSPALGRARADEIRAAIGRVRAAGKPVAAHLIAGGPAQYLVALACDTIAMPPAAPLEITGVRTEMMFFKSMLDRLGVQAEILQVGEFKGAGEPLTRDSMSPQLRRQYEAFVGDLYEQLVERVAAGRQLPADKARELIDTGVFTPEAARAARLIDAVAYEDEVFDAVAARARLDGPKVVRDYAARKMDADFSGIGGLVKLVEMLSGQKSAAPAGRDKRIAIVHVTGEIRDGKGRDDLLGASAAGSETVIEAVREAARDEAVAAIVLRIDSPGGSALASDLIWREVKRAGKPVVASLSDIAASGGYYIAVAADRIVAAPGTLTGSIGVVGGKVAVGGGLEKLGIHTDVVSKGRNAGWLSTTEPFTAAGREAFLGTMQDVYRLFTTKVAAGRKLELEKVKQLAEGRVFTGRMAKEAGLVDRLGTLEDAVAEAKQLAGIPADEAVDRQLLPEPRGLFEDLFGMAGGGTTPVARGLAAAASVAPLHAALLQRIAASPGLDALVAEVGALELLASGRPLFMLPARIHVK
jgi:protease-4